MAETCETCRFFLDPGPTAQEAWEADERPIASGFRDALRWLWNPSRFRPAPPDGWDRIYDGIGTCVRRPEYCSHRVDDWCGEHSPKGGPDA